MLDRPGHSQKQGSILRTPWTWLVMACALHMRSPHVRESMTVLDSGFHAVDSGFLVLDSGFQLSGFRIPKRAGFQFFFLF